MDYVKLSTVSDVIVVCLCELLDVFGCMFVKSVLITLFCYIEFIIIIIIVSFLSRMTCCRGTVGELLILKVD